jgi:hypothetical protein
VDGPIEKLFAPQSYSPVVGADGGAPTFVQGPLRVAWQEHGGSAGDRVIIWDDDQQRVVSCAIPSSTRLTGITAQGGSQMAFVADNQGSDMLLRGPLLLVFPERAAQGDGSGACALIASQDVAISHFSADGTAMFWWVVPDTGDAELWTAASDGGAARRIGAGAIADPQFVTNTEIQLQLGRDLVWVDVRDDPVNVHAIAEGVFAGPPVLFPETPWLITGYELSEQDGTGKLALVNWRTDEKRLISGAVVWYALVTIPAADGGASVLGILYFVRGRNPSAQDGLWLATIQYTDLR